MGKKNKNTATTGATTKVEGKKPTTAATTLGGPTAPSGPGPKVGPKFGAKTAVKAVHGPAGRRAPPRRAAREASLTPPTVTLDDDDASSRSNDLCLQCDLMTFTVEEAIKTFSESKSQDNLHLVLKEIRYMCLEIGRCCGQPLHDDSRDDESSISSGRERIFWENLEDHVASQKPPFQAPPRPPATILQQPASAPLALADISPGPAPEEPEKDKGEAE